MTDKELIRSALEALESCSGAPHWETLQTVVTALREALANEALDKMAENARELGLDYEPAQQEPVAFLANGTRFKMAFFESDENGAGNTGTYVTCFNSFEKELDGRWVALVSAEDDCHLKLTPPAQRSLPDFLVYDGHETPQYIEGWNDCRELMKGMR